MKLNKKAFTLIELIVTITITSLILVILWVTYPKFMETLWEQKEKLNFQQTFVLDSFYVNNIIEDSTNYISSYSSWVFNNNSSYLSLLNWQWRYHYSVIYQWDEDGKIISSWNDKKINVKNTFLYSSFVKIGSDIYFTNPWKHTIEKYSSGQIQSQVMYWITWESGFSNVNKWIFNTPTWLATDWTNLYISDSWNNCIRAINLSNWIIQKVAGNCNTSWFNDWESYSTWTILTQSLFDFPTSIEFYNNNLYISDTFNNRIRKIDFSEWKIFTLVWDNERWFNFDNGLAENVNINSPLAMIKTFSWIIFWDTLNWKIRYLNEENNQLTTIIWIDKVWNNKQESNIKYIKNYYNSYLQKYSSWFYFNDLYRGIIYDYNFWWDLIIWNKDDTVKKIFWSNDNNLLINWDFENDINSISSTNDITPSDKDLFYTSNWNYLYPIFWDNYLVVDTRGKTASWYINFSSQPIDWDILQVWNKVFEFDNDMNFLQGNILIPIWIDLSQTIENISNELNNYNIKNEIYSNSIKVIASNYWVEWNNIAFSWTLNLSPSSNHLEGWITYTWWNFQLSFSKNLEKDKKYKLSFYVASDSIIEKNIFDPIFSVDTGTWNIEEKIVYINDRWNKREFIFSWTWNIQDIIFNVNPWEYFFMDYLELIPLWESQFFDNLLNIENINFWILNSFYIDNWNYYLPDLKNKKMYFLNWVNLKNINDDFVFFDIGNLLINLKNDYQWNSKIKSFTYEIKNNNIIYTVWQDEFKIKLSSNINYNYEK